MVLGMATDVAVTDDITTTQDEGSIDINNVDWSNPDSTDWGQVQWDQVDWNGMASDASNIDWGEVGWSELDRTDWDKLDWNNVQNEELDANDLSTSNNNDNLIAAKNKKGSTLDGKGGKDDLVGWIGKDILNGGQDADELTGGKAADIFQYNALSDSRLKTLDHITDLAIGTDAIDAVTAVSAKNLKECGKVGSLTQSAIAKVLTPTLFLPKTAATFTMGTGAQTRTFLAINDNVAGFNSNQDSLIELTGYTGNLANLAII